MRLKAIAEPTPPQTYRNSSIQAVSRYKMSERDLEQIAGYK